MAEAARPAAGRLEPLEPRHLDALIDMAREFAAVGDDRYAPLLADPDGWLAAMARFESGVGLAPGLVPQQVFVRREGDRIVAAARLRRRLTPTLECDGGHIGYEVRPSARRRGVATRLLRGVLAIARAHGMSRVLLTAAADNAASRRVIERCGGRPDGTRRSPHTGETMHRYWIALRGAPRPAPPA